MLDHHGNLLEMIRGQVQELARQSSVLVYNPDVTIDMCHNLQLSYS